MNILTVENLSKSFGEKLLFENITFGLDAGQKAALIAKNGTGKSSLIRIMAGEDEPDSGQVTIGNNVRISYLPQNPEMNHNQRIIDYLFDSDNEMVRLARSYNELTRNPEEHADRKSVV